MISAGEVRIYREGITGSHFGVGGMERINMLHQVSLLIGVVLRLSMAAFRVRSNIMWSCIIVPSA